MGLKCLIWFVSIYQRRYATSDNNLANATLACFPHNPQPANFPYKHASEGLFLRHNVSGPYLALGILHAGETGLYILY